MEKYRAQHALIACLLAVAPAFAGDPAQTGITSRAQLDAYLAAHPDNPLEPLSAGARERFLYSLKFNENGLVGVDGSDLADELDDAQIRAVFVLFGEGLVRYAPASHADETRAFDRRGARNSGIGALERQYNDFYRAIKDLDEPDSALLARKTGEIFDTQLASLFKAATLRGADDHELRLLRMGARRAAMQTRLPQHVAAFNAVYVERKRRGHVSSDDIVSLRDLYLSQHRFADARRLSSDHPGANLPALPQFRDSLGAAAGRATVWKLDESGRRLDRTAVDLAPLQILVTAACHISKDAAAGIAADPLLGPAFEHHARWLVQAPGVESIDGARDWNRELPHSPVAMIYDRAEWALLPEWTMPKFYIVRDGRVLDSMTGWDGSSSTRAELVAVLRRHGLIALE